MNQPSSWTVSDRIYEEFCAFLEKKCGIVLGPGKQYLIRSRLVSLLPRFKMKDIDSLLESTISGHHPTMEMVVVDAMTTNETSWFRDCYPFQILAERIVPELISKNIHPRIWSAACSSGQEPYSMAMAIQEAAQATKKFSASSVTILASDISDTMINMAKTGIYDNLALGRGLSLERKHKFFETCKDFPDCLKVTDSIRRMVAFKTQNLLDNISLLGHFDVIFCRNVLIYFSIEEKTRVIKNFADALRPGGYLFLGSSEFLSGISNDFEMIRLNPGMFFKKKA